MKPIGEADLYELWDMLVVIGHELARRSKEEGGHGISVYDLAVLKECEMLHAGRRDSTDDPLPEYGDMLKMAMKDPRFKEWYDARRRGVK